VPRRSWVYPAQPFTVPQPSVSFAKSRRCRMENLLVISRYLGFVNKLDIIGGLPLPATSMNISKNLQIFAGKNPAARRIPTRSAWRYPDYYSILRSFNLGIDVRFLNQIISKNWSRSHLKN
jgi:hypothetical protein